MSSIFAIRMIEAVTRNRSLREVTAVTRDKALFQGWERGGILP